MLIIPSIDIRDGKQVRLYQGDYGRETVYSESPLEVAEHWAALGASRLHIVDLDGARAGAPVNLELVGEIASSVPVPVQLSGGIRTPEAASRAVSMGVGRVVLGTAAAEEPRQVKLMCRELGADAVVISIDARDGHVVVQGWTRSGGVQAHEMVVRAAEMGVGRFVYTDVSRDGTLTEPNFRAIDDLARRTELKMLVAGGVSSIDHLHRLDELGVEGAIIGKAAYTGDIDMAQAIGAFAGSTNGHD